MLTTIHKAELSWTGKMNRQTGDPIYKPTAIIQYTRNMGGVDLSDQLMHYYHFLRRSCKWWRKLWIHLLNMCIMNAYILNKKFGSQKLTHTEYRIYLAQYFLESAGATATRNRSSARRREDEEESCADHAGQMGHWPRKLNANGKGKVIPLLCKHCSVNRTKGRRTGMPLNKKKTTVQCSSCEVPLCITPCFALYHGASN